MTDAAFISATERLWHSARYLPHSVRLLGTRYRVLFLAYAQHCRSEGETAPVADALAFLDFLLKQNRIALLPPEKSALSHDAQRLKRRYRLLRQGEIIKAVEMSKLRQWLGV